MRHCGGIVGVLLAASLATGDGPGDKKKSEAEWAKAVAVDFLKSVQAKETKQSLQLLTPKLAARLEQVADVKRSIQPPTPLHEGSVDSWEFASEKVAPDKDEVAFGGKVVGKYSGSSYESSFTIRVVKDKDAGRWRIDYFLFEECKARPAKK
jgi:hypothetical protein